jgi:fructose-1,6-bisphosphatase/inositol monophosphatase family enzyme
VTGKRQRFQPLLEELFKEMEKEFKEMRADGLDREDISEGKDIVTEVDRRMTDIVTSFFLEKEEKYQLASEELSKDDRSEGSEEPDYTVVFDEIDGTANMKDYAGPFGPIVGIAEGSDPDFEDVVAAGFLELTREVFYHAYLGEGAYRRIGVNGEDGKISSSDSEELEVDTGLLVDQAMFSKKPEISEGAWESWCNDFGCQGHHYGLVAEGSREAFMTGGYGLLKQKNTAEELAGMYLLVTEAGGAVTDWNTRDISGEKIGMEEGLNHDVVAASTRELAEKICGKILDDI